MDGFKEQSNRAIFGASAFALLLDDGAEHVGIVALERMAEVTTSGGVDAQVGGNQERGGVTREDRLLQRRYGGGDAIEDVEDRRQRVLDGAEAALDGGLLRRCAFALRRVLEAERVVRVRGGLGEVRRALIADELHPLATRSRIGDRASDQFAGFALVDDERVEQAALTIADVLNADQLEVDAEDAQVGGIATDLGIGGSHLEREPPGVAVVARWARWLWRWWRRRFRGAVLPRAERTLG